MDRFFLASLVQDLNRAMGLCFRHSLAEHLAHFQALDEVIDHGERHLKVVRYIYSVDDRCPVARLGLLKTHVGQICERFAHGDIHLHYHFGASPPQVLLGERLVVLLHFQLLEYGASHDFNHRAVTALLDDPCQQAADLPKWLPSGPISRALFEDEVMHFCQHVLKTDPARRDSVVDLEERFWRVVNLALSHFQQADYESLVARIDARHRDKVANLGSQWRQLRDVVDWRFAQTEVEACCRQSVRLFQQLMEGAFQP